MKKIPVLSLIAALSCGSVAYAGTMGPVENTSCCLSSFLALEGGYSWNQIDGYNYSLTGISGRLYSRESNNGFTGRLSAGIVRTIDEIFSLSTEIGYGYYGRTTLNPVTSGLATPLPGMLHIRHTLSGFDALAGIAYTDPNYSVYLKAGALVQNMTSKVNADFTPLGLPLVAVFSNSTNHTAVLPELKVGASYNVLPNWALTASYLHAFGASPKESGNFNVLTGNASFYSNTRNSSIDAVLLGVQYSI